MGRLKRFYNLYWRYEILSILWLRKVFRRFVAGIQVEFEASLRETHVVGGTLSFWRLFLRSFFHFNHLKLIIFRWFWHHYLLFWRLSCFLSTPIFRLPSISGDLFFLLLVMGLSFNPVSPFSRVNGRLFIHFIDDVDSSKLFLEFSIIKYPTPLNILLFHPQKFIIAIAGHLMFIEIIFQVRILCVVYRLLRNIFEIWLFCIASMC